MRDEEYGVLTSAPMRASLVVIMMEALYARWLGHNTLES
jgi:hypothetical protein